MDPLDFHRDALGVTQRVVDDVGRAHLELPTPDDASAADRLAAFAGRRL